MGSDHWPLFGLRVRTGRLELRPPNDTDLFALADAAAAGIHEAGTMPFNVPWSEQPAGVLERGVLQHSWKLRASWRVDDWHLALAVVHDGAVVGVQGIFATTFRVTRQVETGSWLTREVQGRGLGREMRAAALALAFEGLGATAATTAAFEDNEASLRVTGSLGYVADGEEVRARKGEAARILRFRIDRAGWEAHRRHEVELAGLGPCLPMFGLSADLSARDDVVDPMV